jgi:acyl-ACP thioesterase
MKQAIWTEGYLASSYLVDFNKQLSLHGLLSLMQETAWLHADHLEHGYQITDARGAGWVLIRQRVQIERWPRWGETLQLRTWLRPPGPVVVVRDFVMLVDQQPVGRAAAHWITIDQASRRPIPLEFPDHPGQFREEGHLDLEPARLPEEKGPAYEVLADFRVHPSDLDMYRHVNNTRFAQWAMDALPWPVRQGRALREYQVNFLAEARLGDVVTVRSASGLRESSLLLQGWRASDDKVLFTARLDL